MKTSERFTDFKDGYIVIDARDAPRLANAIGSRIYKSKGGAVLAAERARRFFKPDVAEHIVVVPVEGQNDTFAVPFIFADGVIVNKTGEIRMAPKVPVTHAIEWDTPGGPRAVVRALCGESIRRMEHVRNPTCPECQRLKADADSRQF